MAKRLRFRTESLLLLRLMLPLIIMIAMSPVVGIFLYYHTSVVLGNEVKASNRLLLEQGMNVLDKRWEALDSFIRRMTEDTKIVRLQQVDRPFDDANLYGTIEARGRLQDYYYSTDMIQSYYILFQNGLVLNSDYTALQDHFDQELRYPDQPADFIGSLVRAYHYRDIVPAQPVTLQGATSSYLTYVRSFGFADSTRGTVIVLIKNSEITKLFDGFQTGGGWAYIADDKGMILTSVAGPQADLPAQRLSLPNGDGVTSRTIGKTNMIVTYATSSYNGWTYVAAQPSQVVLQKITYIKWTTIAIFLAFIILGGFIGVYLVYRSSKPVRSIIHSLTAASLKVSDPGTKGPFGFISHGISQLLARNEEMRDRMERQLPLLRSAFFDRLLLGHFVSEAEMEAVREQVRVEWTGAVYIVALLALSGKDSAYQTADIEFLSRKKWLVLDLVNESGPEGALVHDLDEDKIVLLLPFSDIEPNQAYQEAATILNRLQLDIQQQLGIVSIISVGNVYKRKLDISRSFLEAQQTLIRGEDNRIVWFKELLPNPSGYDYSEATETRLMSLVRTGNREELHTLLASLHRHHFVERSLPVFILKVFLFDVLATVYKISGEFGETAARIGLTAPSGFSDNVESIENSFRTIMGKLEELCEKVSNQRNEDQQMWFRDVLAYVDAGYSDDQLSLSRLAERFQVSETYLSRLFKEKTGINFFDYLEKHRIEHAKRLLLDTEATVTEIAGSVGYSSSNTFGRAFKRTVGISAIAFRNAYKRKNDNN